ncbi:MAG: type II secretion system protein GspN [Desulfobacterium sp.]
MGGKSVFFYVAYTLGVFVIFLYLLFPGEKLATRLSQTLNQSLESVEISVGDLQWHLPLGLGGAAIVVSFPDKSGVVLDHLWLKPVLTTLFNESPALKFDMELYKGTASGMLKAPLSLEQGLNRMPSTYLVDAQFDDISIEQFQYATGQGDITVSCLAGGRLTLSRSQDRGMGGTGEIMISNCAIDIAHGILSSMGISGVNFKTVKITYRLADNRLEILECRAMGPEMTLTVSGKIALNSPLSTSRLDLKGRLQPDAGYLSGLSNLPPMVSGLLGRFKGKGLPFKIKGTLDRPGVTL